MSSEALARFRAACAWPSEGSFALPSRVGASDAFLAWTLARADDGAPRLVLAVAPGVLDAERLAEDLRLLSAGTDPAEAVRVFWMPPNLADDPSAQGLRLKAAAALRTWKERPGPTVVAGAFLALSEPLPSEWAPPLTLAPGRSPPFAELCAYLAEKGYCRVSQVVSAGEWSVRGGLVDFWCPGEAHPARAEFFGDDLESLRLFDSASQRSVGPIGEVQVLAVSAADAPAVSLADVLPSEAVVLALDPGAYVLSDLLPPGRRTVFAGVPQPPDVPLGVCAPVALPGFAGLEASEARHPELFDALRRRLAQHLEAFAAAGGCVADWDGLSGGFELPGLAVVTRADRQFARMRPPRPPVGVGGARAAEFDEFEYGEYVVHLEYGIGRYLGMHEIRVGGRRCEVMTLEYADGATLHVPTTHAHLLSRYVGVKGVEVRLHRIDGRRWVVDLAQAQRSITHLASALLETQARRELAPGFAYDVDCEGLAAFEAAFPYEETADQAEAIASVKRDLAARRPMDRLLCGDAGYGKTEVALRAAYIAALNGRQTAVLAPTTVLAEQHFETFVARFDGTPVRVEALSRLQTSAECRATLRNLASGACDIVIGTHALLAREVAFRDLGLIVIDEEQRFGVRQKESLKRLRETADVLTLSATPIPRTLYLSMTGARDLSLLRTPPRMRVPVETSVVTASPKVVRAAIERELVRGGQVFFLHNRVQDLDRVAKKLRALVPSARIATAHGQMDRETLASRVRAFAQGRYDVLLSTTIIESGIDIPRANTILVDRADCLGLSELYQLRGRVGRGAKQGHALFLVASEATLTDDARSRLEALRRYGGLGGGFDLAVRDLELRGAGNLLGQEQSGHVAAIGFGLYCQLLRRTVARMKGEKVPDLVDVRLNLDFIDTSPSSADEAAAATLPYAYIEEDDIRLGFLKRFAECSTLRSVGELTEELRDRFGPLPEAVRRFARLAELRVRCARLGIGRVDTSGDRAFFCRGQSRDFYRVAPLAGRTPDRRLDELFAVVAAASADGQNR